MVKTSYERALEKQQSENSRHAADLERRERATAIISGQSYINGFRIMDQTAEHTLQKVIECYDGNEDNVVKGNFEIFPEYIRQSLKLEFEKLQMYGMITKSYLWLTGMWQLYITEQAKTYFTNKDNAQNSEKGKSFEIIKQRKQYDVFISHASKDKITYVDELYIVLRQLGISIFYDSDVLSWGDNWKQLIIEGTMQSEFAIIIISDDFFGREWTERELNELLHRQNESGQKIILPLLHGITFDQLRGHYPELEYIQCISTNNYSKETIAVLLAKELIKRYK